MYARSFPNLGWDPTPGDVELTRAAARQVSALGEELGTLVAQLQGADGGRWEGETARAFQRNVQDDLLPLLQQGRESFDKAGGALRGWAGSLSGLQDEADALEREAGQRQAAVDSASRAAGSAPPDADRATVTGLQDRVDQAKSAASNIQQRADELHERYLGAAKSVGGNLDHAGGIAPDEPGALSALVNDIGSFLNDAKDSLGQWIRENAEAIEFVGDVLSTISAVAGVLAFIPPLTAIMLPISAVAALGATAAHGSLLAAGADNASWTDFALAGVGAVAGLGALKAGGQIVKAYHATGRAGQLRKVRTLTGGTTEVAPGMFSVARTGGVMTRGEVGWRVVKLKADQASVTATGIGAPGTAGNVREWGRNTGQGRAPWSAGPRPATP